MSLTLTQERLNRFTWITTTMRRGVVLVLSALLFVGAGVGTLYAEVDMDPSDRIPTSLTAAEWQNIQSAVEQATYQVSEVTQNLAGIGSLRATNARHKMRAAFTPSGVRVVPTGRGTPQWHWGMTVRGYGYEGTITNVLPVQPTAEGHRVEYRHGNLIEWYVNDQQGVEQGFTLKDRPARGAGESLRLELTVDSSLTAKWMGEGQGVQYRDVDGTAVLRYSGLVAWDATGRKLVARMAPLDGGLALQIEDQSAVYPVTIDPTIINESAKLRASDGAAADLFGYSVAVTGDTIVVGAYGADNQVINSGSVYVFVKPANGWTGTLNQQAKLLASDGAGSDFFGQSVAAAGDTVVVGAHQDNDQGSVSGSTYVFVKPPSGWTGTLTQNAKLLASDGAAGDRFGWSVAITGDTIVVGAHADDLTRGSAYVFEKPVGGWTGTLTQSAKLLASDGAIADFFGQSVAVAGDTVVVGAYQDDDKGVSSGSAYVFVKQGGSWAGILNEQAKLLASDGATNDFFGYSVAVADDTVVVGAYQDDDQGSNSGSAYVFEKPVGGWMGTLNEQAKLRASDGAAGDFFGWSVGVAGNTIVVGAYGDDSQRGSAYQFEKPALGWTGTLNETATLQASVRGVGVQFGRSVAMTGGTIVVGAYGEDSFRGSAYVFSVASDSEGPLTSNVAGTPNPASVAQTIGVSATIDDTTTGGSTIAAARYEVRDSTGMALQSGAGDASACAVPLTGSICPTTTGFDAVTETVATSIAAGTLAPGVYDLCVQGQDANLNLGAFACSYLVVYDPSGSFVTGGGWIQSSPGFCTLTTLCEAAEGKAHFGFMSKYKKGATVPSGGTQFAFREGQLDFLSTEYEWLVVGGPQAQFKGSGTINDLGDYGFLLTAKDSAIQGGPATDTFRIKIWDKGTGLTVYDNGTNQPIGGGNVVIH
ncbi:MAG: FG-GAP repeat protein [Nitrospira sp.]|nr:FG-GAP repeat protein [Nitrospira sp.]